MKTSIRVEFIEFDGGHGAAARGTLGGSEFDGTVILGLDPCPP